MRTQNQKSRETDGNTDIPCSVVLSPFTTVTYYACLTCILFQGSINIALDSQSLDWIKIPFVIQLLRKVSFHCFVSLLVFAAVFNQLIGQDETTVTEFLVDFHFNYVSLLFLIYSFYIHINFGDRFSITRQKLKFHSLLWGFSLFYSSWNLLTLGHKQKIISGNRVCSNKGFCCVLEQDIANSIFSQMTIAPEQSRSYKDSGRYLPGIWGLKSRPRSRWNFNGFWSSFLSLYSAKTCWPCQRNRNQISETCGYLSEW